MNKTLHPAARHFTLVGSSPAPELRQLAKHEQDRLRNLQNAFDGVPEIVQDHFIANLRTAKRV